MNYDGAYGYDSTISFNPKGHVKASIHESILPEIPRNYSIDTLILKK